MALISHAEWIDRFGDEADRAPDEALPALTFRVVGTAPRAPTAPSPESATPAPRRIDREGLARGHWMRVAASLPFFRRY